MLTLSQILIVIVLGAVLGIPGSYTAVAPGQRNDRRRNTLIEERKAAEELRRKLCEQRICYQRI